MRRRTRRNPLTRRFAVKRGKALAVPRLVASSIIRPDVMRAIRKMKRDGFTRKGTAFWANRILQRYKNVYSGGGRYGYDWATMRVQEPEVYNVLKFLEKKHKSV